MLGFVAVEDLLDVDLQLAYEARSVTEGGNDVVVNVAPAVGHRVHRMFKTILEADNASSATFVATWFSYKCLTTASKSSSLSTTIDARTMSIS